MAAIDRVPGCSARALITGMIGALVLSFGSIWNDMIIKGSGLSTWNWTPGSICVFFVLVAVVNTALGAVRRSWALTPPELAVAYVMIVVANTICGRGFASQLLPVITGAVYYATPENGWADGVQPYLPMWPLPQGRDALWQFYEGSPDGAIPWDPWILPLIWWGIFALALFLTMTCVMVILRKQWVEHERLAYPMVQLPLAMIDEGRGSPGLVKPLFKNWLLWAGFAIPFTMGSINALHNYFPFMPTVVTYLPSIPILRGMAAIQLRLSTSMIGFSYFVPPSIAAGLCFFYLVTTVQRGMWGFMGWGSKEDAMGAYSQYTEADIIHQAMGAMIVLVIGILWIGRAHLRAVLRKALFDDPDVDDSGEILSYRAAVAGTVIGFAVMGVWLWRMGLAPPWVLLVLALAFVIYIAISRTVAQGGVANFYPPSNPPDLVVSGVGSSVIGAKGMGALAIGYAWSVDTLILMMTAVANGLKLLSEVGDVGKHRRMFGGIVAVICVCLPLSVGTILWLAYDHGAINLSPFYFNNVSQYPFRFMQYNIDTPAGPNGWGWLHTGVGATVMASLMLVQHRYLWWPFHPLGYPVSCVFGGMWFSVFIALVIKTAILKYGGPSLLARVKPFFLGLILGEALVGGFWVVVDAITGMQSNTLRGVFFG